MTAAVIGQNVSEEKQKELVAMVKAAQPHPDVIPGLQKLQEAGFRMATLSNSPTKSSIPHLEKVGLSGFFEKMMTVDGVKKFKPHTSPYNYAAAQPAHCPVEHCSNRQESW